MSKIIEAVLEGGVVKVGALPITGTIVFSEGAANSQGILILEGGEKYYIAKTTPDLKTTLTQLVTALEKIADAITKTSTTFTSVGANMTGPTTTPPPTLAADVALLVTYATAVTAAKTQLNTLKGALK